jgi:hypothetical protein
MNREVNPAKNPGCTLFQDDKSIEDPISCHFRKISSWKCSIWVLKKAGITGFLFVEH